MVKGSVELVLTKRMLHKTGVISDNEVDRWREYSVYLYLFDLDSYNAFGATCVT